MHQTVNLTSPTSVVRIHPLPPHKNGAKAIRFAPFLCFYAILENQKPNLVPIFAGVPVLFLNLIAAERQRLKGFMPHSRPWAACFRGNYTALNNRPRRASIAAGPIKVFIVVIII